MPKLTEKLIGWVVAIMVLVIGTGALAVMVIRIVQHLLAENERVVNELSRTVRSFTQPPPPVELDSEGVEPWLHAVPDAPSDNTVDWSFLTPSDPTDDSYPDPNRMNGSYRTTMTDHDWPTNRG